MRSWLYVPGNSPGKMINAGVYGADGIVFDLEDAVPVESKDEARLLTAEMLSSVDFGSASIAVRINAAGTPWWREDLSVLSPLILSGLLQAIRLPKVEHAETVLQVIDVLEALEKTAAQTPALTPSLAPEKYAPSQPQIQLQILLETPLGIEQAFNIAAASKRISALCFGAEDYCSMTGIDRRGPSYALDYPRSRIVSAAAAVGIEAYDTVWGSYRDAEGLKADASRARVLGFQGKSVIHPDQIDPVNTIFSRTEKEIAWAESVLSAAGEPEIDSKGVRGGVRGVGGKDTGIAHLDRGAFAAGGMMVDAPVLARARRILKEAAVDKVTKQ
jgi:citrate lyase subunit beta / citryl-CoA lyase